MSLVNEVLAKKQELVKIIVTSETQRMINRLLGEEPAYVYDGELTDLGNELAELEWNKKRLTRVANETMSIVERNCTLASYATDNSHPPVFITELAEFFHEHINT